MNLVNLCRVLINMGKNSEFSREMIVVCPQSQIVTEYIGQNIVQFCLIRLSRFVIAICFRAFLFIFKTF